MDDNANIHGAVTIGYLERDRIVLKEWAAYSLDLRDPLKMFVISSAVLCADVSHSHSAGLAN